MLLQCIVNFNATTIIPCVWSSSFLHVIISLLEFSQKSIIHLRGNNSSNVVNNVSHNNANIHMRHRIHSEIETLPKIFPWSRNDPVHNIISILQAFGRISCLYFIRAIPNNHKLYYILPNYFRRGIRHTSMQTTGQFRHIVLYRSSIRHWKILLLERNLSFHE